MHSILWLDTELRSNCDLKARGAYIYARDASTRLLCLSYAFDGEDVQTWTPDQPFPQRVADHFASGGQIRAHNAGFDRLMLWYVVCPDFGVPEPQLEQFYCTAAQGRANCAPGSLEDIGRFMGASMKKDHRGAALIRKCCVPPFKHSAQDLADLIAYCEQDVRAMREISGLLRDLTPTELADYHVNERINDQGVLVDVRLCRAAMRYASTESEDITRTVWEATGGLVGSVRSPRMREWVLDRLTPEQLKLTVVKEKPSIDKTVRANLLACDDLDPLVREVVQAADDLWASSVAKFQRLAQLADVEDARVRGAFVFAGGSATGRASAYGAQVHNFTRKVAKDPAAVRQSMVRGHRLVPDYGSRITDVLRGMLRPALIPAPGHVFVVADWSAIEGRVNPWLADSDAGDAKLRVFRSGRDPYIVNAAITYNVDYINVTDSQRQVGKVQELALGFAGGVGAFAAMGRGYGLTLPEHEAQKMVNAWRRANPWASPFWNQLESAYLFAMRNPLREFSAGRVTYLYDRQHLWYSLPSGRVLCYPFAKFDEEGNLTYAKAAWKPMADASSWPRARLWKGLACENITQATAHDLLRHALRELVWSTVLHVHDEIVLEVPEADADRALAWMTGVMTTPPDWAKGLPLAVGAKVMTRYGK